MREELRALAALARLGLHAGPALAAGVLAVAVLEALAHLSWSYVLKVLTDSVVRHDLRGVLAAALVYGASLAVVGVATLARVRWTTTLRERTAFLVDERLGRTALELPTLEHYERPDYADRLALLRSRHANLGEVVDAVVGNLQVVVMLLGTAVLLARIHVALVVLPLFALPSLATGRRAARILEGARAGAVERARTWRHCFELCTRAESATEVRTSGLAGTLVAEHDDLSRQEDAALWRASLRGASIATAGWIVFAAAYVGALVFVTLRAVHDPQQTTIGDVLLTYALAFQTQALVRDAGNSVTSLWRNLETAGHMVWLEDIARSLARGRGAVPPPDRIERGIVLDGLSFHYSGEARDVLHDVDLTIPAGTVVALVGENGSGKTTLVKLLCRLYEPTRGAIALDGVDLASLDLERWRSRTSAAFQDFARLELVARETVGVGDLARLEDAAAVAAALARGGAEDVVARLPARLETPLGRSFSGGVELSRGEWQKLGLSRAMMREAPLLLVLDEPTASLDVETEHALFTAYADAARRLAAGNGAITLLVSHRFSTVSAAELIVVLDKGRIVEAGGHRELVERGGLYAELYSLQAAGHGLAAAV
jgi:ATP-binding cassette subfamily B protein